MAEAFTGCITFLCPINSASMLKEHKFREFHYKWLTSCTKLANEHRRYWRKSCKILTCYSTETPTNPPMQTAAAHDARGYPTQFQRSTQLLTERSDRDSRRPHKTRNHCIYTDPGLRRRRRRLRKSCGEWLSVLRSRTLSSRPTSS